MTARSAKTAAFLTAQLERLRVAGIPVFYIKGNHDAENPITGEVTLPDNVHVFDGRGGKVQLADADIWIHGVSFSGKHAPDSLLKKFGEPVSGAVNIAMLHTSLAGAAGHDNYPFRPFGEDGGRSNFFTVLCDPADCDPTAATARHKWRGGQWLPYTSEAGFRIRQAGVSCAVSPISPTSSQASISSTASSHQTRIRPLHEDRLDTGLDNSSKIVNALNKFPKSMQPTVKADLREIWQADTRAAAEIAMETFSDKYGAKYEKAVTCLTKDREALLTFYVSPTVLASNCPPDSLPPAGGPARTPG